MRTLVCFLVLAAAAGCSGVTPEDPPMMGANEMQPRPGLFSGPTGEFIISGATPPAGTPASGVVE